MKKETHILIIQTLPYIKKNIYNKFDFSILNIYEFISNIIPYMVGDLKIYKHFDDGSREELTKDYIQLFQPFENILPEKMVLYSSSYGCKKYTFQSIKTKFYGLSTSKFTSLVYPFTSETIFSRFSFTCNSTIGLFSENILTDKNNSYKGYSYESFCGTKYESLGYIVKYNGIDKKYNDGGIDLICTKDDELILCQCKNWNESNRIKLSSLNLKAFLGDCYLYILKHDIKNKNLKFHFLVSQDNLLDVSAIHFLKNTNFLKFKYLSFE
jgi:hypothetical protein